ncbi:hypothetical protein AB6N23_07910 [Cellulomonas sp. 179-A 9B4 NHS]|uniref:hypothetical protein n=1 Tax=Cellulomonas sp. 179-A 9B4 NHS TaxID=3142379 RepID=UPI00399F91B0
MTVSVDPAALDTAADEWDAAGAAVRAADVAGPFTLVPEGLPGSATADASLWVSTRLAAAVQVLGERLQGAGAAAAGSAEDFRLEEETALRLLAPLAPL